MQASIPHNAHNALSGGDAVFAIRQPLSRVGRGLVRSGEEPAFEIDDCSTGTANAAVPTGPRGARR